MTKLSEALKAAKTYAEKIATLEVAVNELNLRVDELIRQPKAMPNANGMTSKGMAMAIGVSKNHEKTGALKFFARQYCEEFGLVITKADPNNKKAYERFPQAAADYAMEKVKGGK